MTWWVIGGVVGWLTTAPVVAVVTGSWFARRSTDSVALDEALTVPAAWTRELAPEA